MAAMAARHPDRFPGFFASLATSDRDAMLAEARRAVGDLGARGVQIFTHHGGGLIPMVEGRLGLGLGAYGTRTPPELRERERTPLQGEPLAAFRRFYTDTATFGSAAGVANAVSFFGIDRVLFASDMPFGPDAGAGLVAASLEAVNALRVSPDEISRILSGNAERLLGSASAPLRSPW